MICDVLELVSLRGKNPFGSRPSNEVPVPFRLFFENGQRAPTSFSYGTVMIMQDERLCISQDCPCTLTHNSSKLFQLTTARKATGGFDCTRPRKSGVTFNIPLGEYQLPIID